MPRGKHKSLLLFAGAVSALVLFLWLRPKTDTPDETADTQAAEPLPEAEREFLWEAEHLGLVLTNFGWKPALSQLKESNATGIGKCLANRFTSEWNPADQKLDTRTVGLAASRTTNDERNDNLTLNASEFATRLIERRSQFSKNVKTKFKLLAVTPVERDKPDGPWAGRGRITMTGTSPGGAKLTNQLIIEYTTVRPSESALEAGSWLLSCNVVKERTVQSDAPLFSDATSDSGIATEKLHDNWFASPRHVNTGGIYLCDYNHDGCTDMLVTDIESVRGVMLYAGSPTGKFTDASISCGLPSLPDTMNAVFADVDGDGWEDLVIPDKGIFRNNEGASFSDVTNESNLTSLIFGQGQITGLLSITGVSVVDFDRDGFVDLYVTRGDAIEFRNGSWIDGKSGQSIPNQLLRNTGNFQFEDVTHKTGAGGGNRSVFTSVWLDVNNDRWPDAYVINEFGAGLLLVNRDGKSFDSVELSDKSSDFASMGLGCGDFNNDGLTDLYVSNMFSSAGNRVMDNLPEGHYDGTVSYKLRRMVSGNELHLNKGDNTFEQAGQQMDIAQVGWGWGPAVADLNNDGWLDIYATCGFMSHTQKNPDG